MAGFKSGLLWGAFFGGIAGLMNAPRKGAITRRELKIFLEEVKADANDLKFKADHLQTLIDRLKGEGLDTVNELVEDIQVDIRHFMEDNQPRINRVLDRIDVLQANLEENMNNLSNNSEN